MNHPKGYDQKYDKFIDLAHLQRGEPEEIMRKISILCPGVMGYVVEHAGDMIHRATEHHAVYSGLFGSDYSCGKARNVLDSLTHPYGFLKEFEENIEASAEYNKVNENELRKKVYALLLEYAKAHESLPAYNDLHRAFIKVCSSIGRLKIKTAVQYLKWIVRLCNNKERYLKVASSIDNKSLKRNPKILKDANIEAYTTFDAVAEENILLARLPDGTDPDKKYFIMWEPNTYQVWLFDNPENVDIKKATPFLPRDMTRGRILPYGMQTPFERFFKMADKSVLASAQFIDHSDKVEVIFMATRPGWKKLSLMRALIKFIEKEFKKPVEYWEPTKAGEKFIKKMKKNPETLIGGAGDLVPDSFFNKRELERGIKHELEHTKSRKIAKEIAKDHLVEDANYYKKIAKIEHNPHPKYAKGVPKLPKGFSGEFDGEDLLQAIDTYNYVANLNFEKGISGNLKYQKSIVIEPDKLLKMSLKKSLAKKKGYLKGKPQKSWLSHLPIRPDSDDKERMERIISLWNDDSLNSLIVIDGVLYDGYHRLLFAHAMGQKVVAALFGVKK